MKDKLFAAAYACDEIAIYRLLWDSPEEEQLTIWQGIDLERITGYPLALATQCIEYHGKSDNHGRCEFVLFWMKDFHSDDSRVQPGRRWRCQYFFGDPLEHGFPRPEESEIPTWIKERLALLKATGTPRKSKQASGTTSTLAPPKTST